tara:strand:- start:4867 stop:5898 length:1032 start_codon:yes stop_codon:yes gene_type:complete
MTKHDPKLISICILSYNRPDTMLRLLKTIDIKFQKQYEIIISDDFSPKQIEIENTINEFSKKLEMPIVFIKNKINRGYDKNLNILVKKAKGKWLIFMGDDDEFVEGSLEKIIKFLKTNYDLGYVMKSHYLIHENNYKEIFKYYRKTTFFEPGSSSIIQLFRKSVYIAGFIINRKLALPFVTDRFDGSMLNQLYLLSEVVYRHSSAYLDIPFTQQYKSLDHNKNDVMFNRVKKIFVPREPSISISLDFLNSFSKITNYIDQKYNLTISNNIKVDMSKYMYPSLSIHREKGLKTFIFYVLELNKLGFNCTIYYYIYVLSLILFKKKKSDFVITLIKKIIGYTPKL